MTSPDNPADRARVEAVRATLLDLAREADDWAASYEKDGIISSSADERQRAAALREAATWAPPEPVSEPVHEGETEKNQTLEPVLKEEGPMRDAAAELVNAVRGFTPFYSRGTQTVAVGVARWEKILNAANAVADALLAAPSAPTTVTINPPCSRCGGAMEVRSISVEQSTVGDTAQIDVLVCPRCESKAKCGECGHAPHAPRQCAECQCMWGNAWPAPTPGSAVKRCACPSPFAGECTSLRYGAHADPGERCECACHEREDDDA